MCFLKLVVCAAGETEEDNFFVCGKRSFKLMRSDWPINPENRVAKYVLSQGRLSESGRRTDTDIIGLDVPSPHTCKGTFTFSKNVFSCLSFMIMEICLMHLVAPH